MTREGLIDFVKFSKGHWTFTTKSGKEISEEQVIKALEQEPVCEDCISRERMLKYFEGWKNQIKYYHPYAKNFDIPYEEAIQWVKDMPSVNPQKPICPSAGIDCEDCPAYEDVISRKAVLNTLENMDKALDEDRTVENYKELLRECYKVLPKKSEWQQDHEILKAYSDGASAVLDKIRAEIADLEEGISSYHNDRPWVFKDEVLQIIDKYKAESEVQE